MRFYSQVIFCFFCGPSFLVITKPKTARPTKPIRRKAEPMVITAFSAGLGSASWAPPVSDGTDTGTRLVGFIKIPIPENSITTNTIKAIVTLFISLIGLYYQFYMFFVAVKCGTKFIFRREQSSP